MVDKEHSRTVEKKIEREKAADSAKEKLEQSQPHVEVEDDIDSDR